MQDRAWLINKVRQWGGPTSDAQLDPLCKHFTCPTIEGAIGYRLHSGCALAFGDPLCAPSDRQALVHAFHEFCEKEGCNVIYIIVSEEFAKECVGDSCKVLLEFGEELTLNPTRIDPKEGPEGRLLRNRVRHASKEGVEVLEVTHPDAELERAIEDVGNQWLASRHGPQIYTSHLRFFEDQPGKRCFYARQGSRIVGALLLHRLESRGGWLLVNEVTVPDAPKGTPELLIAATLEQLQREECGYVTFGPVTNNAIGEIVGLSRPVRWLVRTSFKFSNRFFHLGGKNQFWRKFQPERRPCYLLMKETRFGCAEVRSVMHGLNMRF